MSEKTVSPDGVEEAGDERWMDDTTSEKKFVWWYVLPYCHVTTRLIWVGFGLLLLRGKGLWHDIGYDAAYIQLWAATVFWVATM